MAGTNISRANGSGSATNKFTLSMWVKRGQTDQGRMFSATGGSGDVYFRFNAGGFIEWSGHGSNASSAGYFIQIENLETMLLGIILLLDLTAHNPQLVID